MASGMLASVLKNYLILKTFRCQQPFTMACRANSDMAEFRKIVKNSKHVVVVTGAGVSAESGVPTFRGEGGLWRTYKAQVCNSLQMHHSSLPNSVMHWPLIGKLL